MILSVYRTESDGLTRWEWRLTLDSQGMMRVRGLWKMVRSGPDGEWSYATIEGHPDIPADVLAEAERRFRAAPIEFDQGHFETLRRREAEGLHDDPDHWWLDNETGGVEYRVLVVSAVGGVWTASPPMPLAAAISWRTMIDTPRAGKVVPVTRIQKRQVSGWENLP